MKKHDYTALDGELLKAIKSGKHYTREISCAEVIQEAEKLVAAHNGDMSPCHFDFKPAWRFIDNRLQALRKSGKIEWLGPKNGWQPA